MRAHPIDSRLYGHLWSTDETQELFDEESRLACWLDILVVLARSQADVGLIPKQAAEVIAERAKVEYLDLEYVAEETRSTGHSTLGLIHALRRVLPDDVHEWVYYGATVQDLTDTWMALAMRRISDILERDLALIEEALADLACKHRDTLMCGRTHGQIGMPITFGFKAAVWTAEVRRHRDRLREARPRFEVAQLGGALGTMEFWGDKAFPLLETFAARLRLHEPEIPWLTARDGVAEFLNLLAVSAATLGKIGLEVYELQRPEIGELREPAAARQVGSITMPHKRNPELSEHLVTLARTVRANASLATEGMVHEHERDGRAWKTEWIAFPEACHLTAVALRIATRLVDGLEVNVDRMSTNLDLDGGYVMSGSVLRALAPYLGKHAAQNVLQQVTTVGSSQRRSLRAALEDDRRVTAHLSQTEIDSCLDLSAATGSAGAFVDRVLHGRRAAARNLEGDQS